MSEHKFPEAQPIDWDALEEGDRVLIEAVIEMPVLEPKRMKFTGCNILLTPHLYRLHGHVIKAPRPIAVGDTVVPANDTIIPGRLATGLGRCVVVAIHSKWVGIVNALNEDSEPDWLLRTNLVRVEP